NLLKKRYVLGLNAVALLALWLGALLVILSGDLNARGFARFLTISGGLLGAFGSVAGALGSKKTSDMQNLGLLVWAGLLIYFTVYESMRFFTRKSNGTPATADASFASRSAPWSGARSTSTFADFRYRPRAGMPLTSRVGSGKVLRIFGLAGIAIVRSSSQSTAMCFAIVFAETASPSRNRLSWRPYPKYGTTAVRRRAPASRIASARRNSSTIIGSGCVVWTRTTCSPETGPSRRTYRSPSGNPPGCFSKATSTKATESSWAIPRARGTTAEPPTTFIERTGCVVWDVD